MTNLLDNGRFYGNLDEWTPSGAASINRALGYPRAGCVQLDAGASIAQQESASEDSLYTLHYFYRITSGAVLTASYGAFSNTHQTLTPNVWIEGFISFAPDTSLNESVTFAAATATAYIDAVSLLFGALPISRHELAQAAQTRLGALVREKGLLCAPSHLGPDGDYTAAIDEALRAVGAVGPYGEPDVTCVAAGDINNLIDATYGNMLQRLQSDYLLDTDVSLGPRRENRSQIAQNLARMAGASGAGGGDGGGGGRIQVAQMSRSGGWER